ncbi:MAG TPA: ABC transporter ATP-binding protein [Acidimicrobiales bacterium]|nr:ABC transporter ATP-binding protein [Acidimicrobiales bacterium]
MTLLECRQVRKAYGGLVAVDDVDLRIRAGEILGVLGPNGAGKSTLLNIVAGSVRPTAGQVLIDGVDCTGLQPHRVADRGVRRTFQVAAVYPRLTVMENLLVGLPARRGESLLSVVGSGRRWRSQEPADLRNARLLLAKFGLGQKEDLYGEELSGGERRLVEIMRATMAPLRLLLLDEPMAGVNPRMMGVIEDYIAELASRGIGIMMIEHRMESVDRICHSVTVMAQGAVIASGKFEDVRRADAVVGAYIAG